MKAGEALKLAQSKLPEIDDREYNSIMGSIKWAANRGKDHVMFGFKCPDEKIIERLKLDGYQLCSWGDNFFMPTMYGVSWAKEVQKKRKWYQIF